MQSIGFRIALYRNSRRWTQQRLASVIGMTQGLLSEIENNKVSPRWEMITRIAEQLEVPLMSLLPLPNDQTGVNGIIINQREQQLLDMLQKTQAELMATKDKLIQLLEQSKGS